MKDKNYVDPKMAYCQAVRNLEDKFHVLELHHVLHDYNKAATYSRRPRPVEAQCLMESLRAVSMLPPSAQRGRSPPPPRGGRA
jgi:hypothetical protein